MKGEPKTIDLPTILAVEATDHGFYEGAPGPAIGPRMFGGQAVAQALLAACQEETHDRLPHSLHAYFLKAGSSDQPVSYRVTTLSEGRSFATRRVEGMQDDTMIFSMIASFHSPETGFEHTSPAPFDLDVSAAIEALDRWRERHSQANASPIVDRLQKRPIEIVPLDPGALFGAQAREPRTGVWMRMREPAGPDPLLQRALLAYASDMMFLRNAMLPHAIRPGSTKVQAASLDHAIYFHETPDFDHWHLYATESPWAGHARGLNRGHFYDESGRMVATVSQESLMRPKGEALERMRSA
ncbi:acyl-CoA thioesterase [Erythrobacter litoralis]|uniref:acyl-CoA thioesterase n=1 Tax=Erythrobacter litoralis TaxID=39960 RepID=UPI0024358B0A|nr:acyl-CoA thioesterase domain-containing protein [Erythrobacter litoralis]